LLISGHCRHLQASHQGLANALSQVTIPPLPNHTYYQQPY